MYGVFSFGVTFGEYCLGTSICDTSHQFWFKTIKIAFHMIMQPQKLHLFNEITVLIEENVEP
jgi:hypothetical protein